MHGTERPGGDPQHDFSGSVGGGREQQQQDLAKSGVSTERPEMLDSIYSFFNLKKACNVVDSESK